MGDRVIVRPQNEANRIHNKGHYGRPLSGGALELDLVEAAYLTETDRLAVQRDGRVLPWPEFVAAAVRTAPDFEIPYLVYRDLRERGYLVLAAPPAAKKAGAQFQLWPRGTERPGPAAAWVRAVNERSPLDLGELFRFVEAAREAKCLAHVTVVDEESDLTYYELATDPPRTPTPSERRLPREARGVLLADRVLVPDAEPARALHDAGFYGKPIAKGLQLSLVETLHLMESAGLRVEDAGTGRPLSAAALRRRGRDLEPQFELRVRVYDELKGRGLTVKTGFKFGTHFRAYESRPEEGHAPYLVQAVPADFTTSWEPVARGVRLSHTVRKRFYFARVGVRDVSYLALGRHRP